EPGTVLLLDSFEQCQPLEPWLRDTFLLRLADGALVVLASRVAPDVEWSLDPGWAQLFAELVVRPLDAAQSDALLAARGVPAEQRSAYVAFAGGSPLALSLAASVPAAAPGAPWRPCTTGGRTPTSRTLPSGPATCPTCCAWRRRRRAPRPRLRSRTGCAASRGPSVSTATRAPLRPSRSWPCCGWRHLCPRTGP